VAFGAMIISVVLVRKHCFSLVCLRTSLILVSNSHMTKISNSLSFSYSFRLNLRKLLVSFGFD